MGSENGEKSGEGGHPNHNSLGKLEAPPLESKSLKKKSFDGDFIIISEFSEQVGPVPLFVIPDWGAEGSFNLNSFVLKIMAVDFQNKSNDPQHYLKDSQVVMPEPEEHAYTFLHHFNLLDVYARGYVRPMCISYITHDREKVMDYFQEFTTKLSKITRVLKKGNHRLFLRDLEDRMADVRHTQAVMSSGQDLDTISPTPTTVNEYLSDLEVMHQKFHRAVATKQLRKAASTPNRLQSSQNVPTTPSEYEDEFDEEDDWEKEESEGKQEKKIDEKASRKDSSGGTSEKSINKAVAELVARDYQPQVIHSLHPRTLHGKSLRDLHGLCDGTSHKAMSLVRALHRHYSRPSTVLALEAFDAPCWFPSSSLLTVGQSVTLNFNLEVDKCVNKVNYQGLDKAASTGSLPHFLNNNSAPVTHNTSSSDDSSNYSSPYSASPREEEAFVNEFNSSTNGQQGLGQSGTINPPASPSLELSTEIPANEDKNNSHHYKLSTPSINYFAAYLWPSQATQQTLPGKGLLDLRFKCAFLRHAVYSILRGRPVIVWGSAQNESTVRGIVQALSILVPGTNSGVAQWRTKQLKMSDLATFKLTGLVRSCPIPKAVEKYVTIFDLENETLKAPPYPATGKFIDDIFAMKRYWPDELTYLAHVHYVLFDIGVKSCLYYHMCCVAVHQLTPQQVSQAQAYVHPYPRPHPHAHHSHGHTHSHLHSHSSHGHTHTHHHSTFMSHQPPQPLRAVSPHAQPHRHPAQYHSQPPSPHIPSSQPPSPYLPPLTSPAHLSQPPSPRQPSHSQPQTQTSQPPSPYHSQPPSPRQVSQPPSPLILTTNPQSPEPLKLDKSQEIVKPTTEGAKNTEGGAKSDAKPEPSTLPRRKTTIGSLQTPVRSNSMPSMADKLRSTPTTPTTTTTTPSNSSNNTIFNTPNITNVNNININSSGGIPVVPSSHNSSGSGDWRSITNTSPSASRHGSWQYGKSFPMQGHRSLSDSQINPAWLPPNAATRDQTRTQFFKQMEILQGDAEIVMYLAEVVKEQQATEVQGTESPVIRLDYSPCNLFHSKATKEAAHGRR